MSDQPSTSITNQNDDEDGVSTKQGSSHASLANFDADAFLSSSLELSLSSPSPLPNGSPISDLADLSHSTSSDTSGSLTPRPDGTSSPVAVADQVLAEVEDYTGTRFTVMKAMGPSSSKDQCRDICWVGIGGLGRAGLFEGDWVSLLCGSIYIYIS